MYWDSAFTKVKHSIFPFGMYVRVRIKLTLFLITCSFTKCCEFQRFCAFKCDVFISLCLCQKK